MHSFAQPNKEYYRPFLKGKHAKGKQTYLITQSEYTLQRSFGKKEYFEENLDRNKRMEQGFHSFILKNFCYGKAQIIPPIKAILIIQKPVLMAIYLNPLRSNKALVPIIGNEIKMPPMVP